MMNEIEEETKEEIKKSVAAAIDYLLTRDNLVSVLSQFILRQKKIDSVMLNKGYVSLDIWVEWQTEYTENQIYLVFLEGLKARLNEIDKLSIADKKTLTEMIQLMESCAQNKNEIQKIQETASKIADLDTRIREIKLRETSISAQKREDRDQIRKLSGNQTKWFFGGMISSAITLALAVIILMTLPHSIPVVFIAATLCFGALTIATWLRARHFSTAVDAHFNKVPEYNKTLDGLSMLKQSLKAEKTEAMMRTLPNAISAQKDLEFIPNQSPGAMIEASITELTRLVEDTQNQAKQISKSLNQAQSTVTTSSTKERPDDNLKFTPS